MHFNIAKGNPSCGFAPWRKMQMQQYCRPSYGVTTCLPRSWHSSVRPSGGSRSGQSVALKNARTLLCFIGINSSFNKGSRNGAATTASASLHQEISLVEEVDSEGSLNSEHWMVSSVHKAIAEMLGTFFLMFAICGSIMVGWGMMGQAMVVGLSLVGLISSLGPVSGAHFNPAITIAFSAIGQCTWSQVPLYAGSQLLGGTLAVWVAMLLYGIKRNGVALTLPSGGWEQSFLMEIVLTFSLSFVATATNHLSKIDGIQGAVAIGLTVAANILLGGSISGASMNPIRSLAPAITQSNYHCIWIYLIAPIIGAILGALSYTSLQVRCIKRGRPCTKFELAM